MTIDELAKLRDGAPKWIARPGWEASQRLYVLVDDEGRVMMEVQKHMIIGKPNEPGAKFSAYPPSMVDCQADDWQECKSPHPYSPRWMKR